MITEYDIERAKKNSIISNRRFSSNEVAVDSVVFLFDEFLSTLAEEYKYDDNLMNLVDIYRASLDRELKF